jgi:hypothetical protein
MRTLSLLFAGLLLADVAQAQTAAEAQVLAVVRRLFDGMRAGDSAMVRSVFDPNARLVSVGVRDGEPSARVTPASELVAAVGRPHEAVWDERIWDTEVRLDGGLASVWTKYAFYLGDRLSHCGVDAFHLVRGADGWKIVGLADTRRQESCWTPPER